jgi:amino acid adenylation domain-containing protein
MDEIETENSTHFDCADHLIPTTPLAADSPIVDGCASAKHSIRGGDFPLLEWNRTSSEYQKHTTIDRLFEAQVERNPNAVAIVFGKEELTYQQLNHRANQLANHLRGLGVGPEVLVGIAMKRSLDMVVALLGILKSGGAYVPMDPAYPKDRLQYILEDANADVLLTQRDLTEGLTKHKAQTLYLDHLNISHETTENFITDGRSDNVAYVIYTSGSTGRPKGVAIEHRSVIALVHWARQVFKPEELAGVLASTSICFDLSIFELFVTLSCGGKVILAENALQLPSLPAANEVALVNTVPSAMAELLRVGGVPNSVSVVNLAGEPLPATLVEQIYQSQTIQKVYDLYGPTETTVYSTFALRKAGEPATIGRPLSNEQIYLLNPSGQPVPVGAAGEMYIGGDGLARGYLHRPELTAEKFVPDPFSSEPGRRLYRTGDLARYRADGNIDFLGRIDQQVKIRGFRVELGEITAVLGKHPAVREAVVIAMEVAPGEKRLVAYIVPKHLPFAAVSELRPFLKEKLPEHMIPSAFVVLKAFPLTPNGKLDRQALPPPEQIRPELARDFIAPRDALELGLTKIWEEMLRIPSVGVKDNFFELGGESIVAGRVFARIRKQFGKQIDPSSLLKAPTIEQLAVLVRQGEESQPWTSLVAIQPAGSHSPLFCMHAGAGTILFYYDLARELGTDQPVYALQAQGVYGKLPPHERVEEMASHYIREMRTVQPEGPYSLAGFCFGAILAYEIAQQLRRQGQAIAFLASFDGGVPGFDYDAARETAVAVRSAKMASHGNENRPKSWISRHWSRIRGRKPKKIVAYLVKKVVLRARRSIGKTKCKIGARYQKKGRGLPEWLRLSFFLWNNGQAEKLYRAETYPGRMCIFVTKGLFADPAMGWKKLVTGGVEVHEIPGEHLHHRDLMAGTFIVGVCEKLKPYLASRPQGVTRGSFDVR